MPPRASKSNPKEQEKETVEKTIDIIYSRNLLRERHFPASEDCQFYNLALERGFKELMRERGQGNEFFVREFYVRSRRENKPMCRARGKTAIMTKEGIRQHYQLPVVENCRFSHFRQNLDTVPWTEILSTLCVEGGNWAEKGVGQWYLERRVMNDEARIWLNFMCYNIMPSAHISDTTREGALLLYLLMTGEPVDIPQIALDSILQCAHSTRANLVFPHLISETCYIAGIPESEDDEKFSGVQTKCYKASNKRAAEVRSRKRGKRVAEEGPEDPAEEVAGSGDSSITLESLSQQIALLQDSFDQRMTQLQNYVLAQEARRQEYIEPLISAMAAQLGVPFPPGFSNAFNTSCPGYRGPFEPQAGPSSSFQPVNVDPPAEEPQEPTDD